LLRSKGKLVGLWRPKIFFAFFEPWGFMVLASVSVLTKYVAQMDFVTGLGLKAGFGNINNLSLFQGQKSAKRTRFRGYVKLTM
jgi:hypothetical protein